MKFNKIFVTIPSVVMLVGLVGCGSGQQGGSEVAPGTYTYEESLPFGTVPWTLELKEGGNYSLSVTKPDGSEYVYTGSYTADGSIVTTGTPLEGTDDIEAGFFNEDYSCEWEILQDGTMKPVNEGDGNAGMIGGMPGGGGFSFDVDYENIAYASNSESQVMNFRAERPFRKSTIP